MELPVTRTLSAHEADGVVFYSFPAFDTLPFIRHGISTRLGGVSEGVWSSMNLGFSRGDDPAHVRENYRRVCAAMGMDYVNVVQSDQQHHTHLYQAGPEDRGRGVTRDKVIHLSLIHISSTSASDSPLRSCASMNRIRSVMA